MSNEQELKRKKYDVPNRKKYPALNGPTPSYISIPRKDSKLSKAPIFLNYNSNTPFEPELQSSLRTPLNDLRQKCPSNSEVSQLIDTSIQNISQMIGSSKSEILFTSGPKESDRQALLLAIECFKTWCASHETSERTNYRPHVISSITESAERTKFLQQCAKYLAIDLTLVPITPKLGHVILEDVLSAMIPCTCFITLSHVTEATGIIQPLREIGLALKTISKKKSYFRPLFHSDISSLLGKKEMNVKELGLDFATFSGKKIYGPKMGALYYNSATICPQLLARSIFGHSPTRDLPGYDPKYRKQDFCNIANFGDAANVINKELRNHVSRFQTLAQAFEGILQEALESKVELLHRKFSGECLSNTLCVAFRIPNALEKLEKAKILCPNIAETNNVFRLSALRACGIPEELSRQALVLSIGRKTTAEELLLLTQQLVTALR